MHARACMHAHTHFVGNSQDLKLVIIFICSSIYYEKIQEDESIILHKEQIAYI